MLISPLRHNAQGVMHGTGIVTKGEERPRYRCTFEGGKLVEQRALSHKAQLSGEEQSYMVSIFQSVLQVRAGVELCVCLRVCGRQRQGGGGTGKERAE